MPAKSPSPPSPPTAFQPGSKVVCIDDTFPDIARRNFLALPRKGQIYTILALGLGPHWKTKAIVPNLKLQECVPNPKGQHKNGGFLIQRFRTLQDFTTTLALHQKQNRPTKPLPKRLAKSPIPRPLHQPTA